MEYLNLNIYLSDLNVVLGKLRAFHWMVGGNNFFVLHSKCEELYNEVNGYIDEVAERILSIGGTPLLTMREYLLNSSLKESKGQTKDEIIVQEIINDYSYLVEFLRNEIQSIKDDFVTQDMLTGMLTSFEKHLWMLKAYLK